MKKEKEELEAGPKADMVQLTQDQREKDEGDLFGIRAIEAGFYAGVHQSRPTSRAGSYADLPNMSSSTLVGGVNAALKGHSQSSSVLTLNMGQTDNNTTSQKNTRPTMKLRPSEAELTGRHVLQIPSATASRRGSDSGDSDVLPTPRASEIPQFYAPIPVISTPDAIEVTFHDGSRDNTKSQVASYFNSPLQSPTPMSPRSPTTQLPTLPATTYQRESRTPSPELKSSRVQDEHSSR